MIPPKMVTAMYTAKMRRDHFFGSSAISILSRQSHAQFGFLAVQVAGISLADRRDMLLQE